MNDSNGFQISVLASGSSGNCLFLETPKKKILVVVGPEGGFSLEEKNKLDKKSSLFVFGDTTLRAETAANVLPLLVYYIVIWGLGFNVLLS